MAAAMSQSSPECMEDPWSEATPILIPNPEATPILIPSPEATPVLVPSPKMASAQDSAPVPEPTPVPRPLWPNLVSGLWRWNPKNLNPHSLPNGQHHRGFLSCLRRLGPLNSRCRH
ncbi:hypothetical protein ABG768_020610 [Culter alburnus]|uniref:Uncharacterized protein n=1 Tax=Culter alburnus TaxID=194366 RepID=A0AAW2AZZ0_CULAL